MKHACTLIALVLFCAFPLSMLSHWGTRWEFGRYWMPRPMIVHGRFADGSPADQATVMLAAFDVHEEFVLSINCFLVAAGLYLVRINRRIARNDAEVREALKDVPDWWLAERGVYRRDDHYVKE